MAASVPTAHASMQAGLCLPDNPCSQPLCGQSVPHFLLMLDALWAQARRAQALLFAISSNTVHYQGFGNIFIAVRMKLKELQSYLQVGQGGGQGKD